MLRRILHYLFFSYDENKINEAFHRGNKAGVEEGIRIGMQRHTGLTSSLSDDENELLIKFLFRHNLVMCYDTRIEGFRVRRNDILDPQKEKVISVLSKTYKDGILETTTTSLISNELMLMDVEELKIKQDRKKK